MGKVALITGASSGIGQELAQIHAQRGGDLIIVARNGEKLAELKTRLEKQYLIKVIAIAQDLSKPDAPLAVYNEVQQLGIIPDFLINNAGNGLLGKFHELDIQKQLDMINLNVVALTTLTYLFLKDFVKRDSGRILNVSSTASLMPGPLQAVYYASKSFVQFLSNALTEELRGTKVTVTNLMPGATATGFGAASGMDKTPMFQKTFPARKVAEDAYEGMLAGKMDVLTGLTVSQKLMLRMVPFIPKRVMLKQVRQMQEV